MKEEFYQQTLEYVKNNECLFNKVNIHTYNSHFGDLILTISNVSENYFFSIYNIKEDQGKHLQTQEEDIPYLKEIWNIITSTKYQNVVAINNNQMYYN